MLSTKMLSASPVIVTLSLFIQRSLAGSDSIISDVEHSAVDSPNTPKSGEMPASVVLILLFMFSSLALICIRHVRREFAQQQKYLNDKSMGAILSGHVSRKSYGSTTAPSLDSSNIDQYIDDSLYGNYQFLDRVDYYVRSIQHVIVEWFEKKRGPVCFEVNPDRTVEAYNKNPEIPKNPNYVPRPFQHSEDYSPSTSPTLQKMFRRNHDRNKMEREKQRQRENQKGKGKEEEEKSYETLDDDRSMKSYRSNKSGRSTRSARSTNNGIVNRMNERISLKHQMEYEDFNDYGRYSADNEYDEIVDDSDRELSDGDNGTGNGNGHSNQRKAPLMTKIVVLDLD